MRGHVTGRVWRGWLQTSKGAGKHDVLSWSANLAKLNPKCHMNYSIIFTEISFNPETSILFTRLFKIFFSKTTQQNS